MKPPRRRVSKDDADYSRGMPTANCGLCEHFTAPDQCEIVIGPVSPKAWCRFFKKCPA
jgi:hypothetical protein